MTEHPKSSAFAISSQGPGFCNRPEARSRFLMAMRILLLMFFPVILTQFGFAQGNDAESTLRVWTSTQNTQVRGVLTEINGNEVSIKREDGHVIRVNISMLSNQDQEIVEEFRRNNRLPLVVAYVGGIDSYWESSMREVAASVGRELELQEIHVSNRTNSDDRQRGRIVLNYGEDRLKHFFDKHHEKDAERHIVLFASHSILAHARLAREYAREVEKYRVFGAKNNISLHVFNTGPLTASSIVRNFDSDRPSPQAANEAMNDFLNGLRGWNLISMPAVRIACSDKLERVTSFCWQEAVPSYLVSAVVFSAITGERPPLVQMKLAIARRSGIADHAAESPSGDGKISHLIYTSSHENLDMLSLLIHSVVNQ